TRQGTAAGDGYAITDEDELPPPGLEEIAALSRAHLLTAARESDGDPDAETIEWARLAAALAGADAQMLGPEAWREAEDLTSFTP
ncbi:hypothetical protein KC217_22640, partial [Mycobacterium tuberculosis]|nr:hypothetical protein [Mycobacterium tuberculosis]